MLDLQLLNTDNRRAGKKSGLQIVRDMSTNGDTYQRAAASLGYTGGRSEGIDTMGYWRESKMIPGTRRLAIETLSL
jgi:hypothetical protein